MSLNKVPVTVKAQIPASLTPVSFIKPSTTGIYLVNTPIEVLLSAAALDNNYPVTVTQACGTNSRNYTNVAVGTNFTAIIPSNFIGSCTFSSSSNQIYDAASPSVTIKIYVSHILTVNAPASITYGQSLSLKVDTSGPQVEYTASFACTTGSYQITGLTTGLTYDIVPAGIYGQVVITVTAMNNSPVTFSLNILKAAGNIPPAFIPGRLPNYPSVYLNVTDGNGHLDKTAS